MRTIIRYTIRLTNGVERSLLTFDITAEGNEIETMIPLSVYENALQKQIDGNNLVGYTPFILNVAVFKGEGKND
jgi:hypothetical protein